MNHWLIDLGTLESNITNALMRDLMSPCRSISLTSIKTWYQCGHSRTVLDIMAFRMEGLSESYEHTTRRKDKILLALQFAAFLLLSSVEVCFYSVTFSHDSAHLASASKGNTVKIWDTSSGKCLQTLKGHSSWVNSVAFSYDSTRLASASKDNTVKIWDTSSGKCLQTLEGRGGWVNSVAFSHDSTSLASASSDRTFKIWDTNSGNCLQTLDIGKILFHIL
jgi:WD40 repeat protein